MEDILYYRNEGHIIKLKNIKEDKYIETTTSLIYDLSNSLLLGKRSRNIIDLIEIGDYVNGYEVLKIDEDGFLLVNEYGYSLLAPINIKSIVTHEKFNKMKFEV